MATNSHLDADAVSAKYRVSSRGATNLISKDMWGPRLTQMANPWSLENPNGTVILRLAENSLMHSEIAAFAEQKFRVDPTDHLTYSTGPRGSMRLRKAAAEYLNRNFGSKVPVTVDEISVILGLTPGIDALSWAVCDAGEGIMIPRPRYNGFTSDIENRSGAVIVGVTYQDVEGYSGFEDVFAPEMNERALTAALERSRSQGIKVRALLISNPHNPLGRCYPVETLKTMIKFCAKHDLHFISDEIYANSVFLNPRLPNPVTFVSVLALDLESMIDLDLVHVLYGASKDFCANGLRLGFLYSRNFGVKGAVSSNSQFSWCPHVLQDIWAAMLENERWRKDFLTTNLKRMAEHYEILTSFLRSKDIFWLESNAAVYVWVDLRRFLVSKDAQDGKDFVALKVGLPQSAKYAQRESTIVERCMGNGVLIPPGTAYDTEEYGWFRLTFTVQRGALEEGLRRMWTVLEDIEKSGWQD